MLGVPDMGKVCATCHVPNYVDTAKQLRDVGVNDIICVAVAPAKDAEAWGQKIDLKDSKARVSKISFLALALVPMQEENGDASDVLEAAAEDRTMLGQ